MPGIEEVVAQMRGGFASKADLQEVEEHLRRLASIQRGTANEIASNKAGLSDYELQLKRVADQVRASQAKTPRFQRLEQCVLRRPCIPPFLSRDSTISETRDSARHRSHRRHGPWAPPSARHQPCGAR